MYCSNCGNYVDGAFCTKCGTPVSKPAPAPRPVQPAQATRPFPVKHVIFAGAAAFLYFLALVLPGGATGAWTVIRIFSILAAGGMVTGLILRDQDRVSSIIFGASTFVFSFCAFLSMVSTNGFYIFADLCVFAGFGLLGVYYILRGKIFADPLKMIFTLATAGMASLILLINFIQLISWGAPAYIVFRSIFENSARILILAVILFHTPYRNKK